MIASSASCNACKRHCTCRGAVMQRCIVRVLLAPCLSKLGFTAAGLQTTVHKLYICERTDVEQVQCFAAQSQRSLSAVQTVGSSAALTQLLVPGLLAY